MAMRKRLTKSREVLVMTKSSSSPAKSKVLPSSTPSTPDTSIATPPDAATPTPPAPSPASMVLEIHRVEKSVEACVKLTTQNLPLLKTSEMEKMRLSELAHCSCDAITMARQLLGSRLVRYLPDGTRLAGRIVECEAYLGPQDAAAHSFRGRRSEKNESMYQHGGHAYIYMIYGIYHCLNVICGREGEPSGVLIRAIEPEEGIEEMLLGRLARKKGILGEAALILTEAQRKAHLQTLCSGPGRLCQALSLDRALNGINLLTSQDLFLEHGHHVESHHIIASSRIGVEYAGVWAKAPLRFSIRDNTYVSKPWPWSSAAAGGASRSKKRKQASPSSSTVASADD